MTALRLLRPILKLESQEPGWLSFASKLSASSLPLKKDVKTSVVLLHLQWLKLGSYLLHSIPQDVSLLQQLADSHLFWRAESC